MEPASLRAYALFAMGVALAVLAKELKEWIAEASGAFDVKSISAIVLLATTSIALQLTRWRSLARPRLPVLAVDLDEVCCGCARRGAQSLQRHACPHS